MENLNKHIEHTLLKQDATKEDFEKLFKEAKEHNFLGVCINPAYIKMAKQELRDSGIKVVTVIGFPLGANKTEVKAFETSCAVADGADEVDMVINVTALKNKDYDYVREDIKAVKIAAKDAPLKVILETDLLTKDEIKKACEICIEAKADFVKTSTGFVKNGVGAKEEDVKLMYETVSPYGLKVKASGGIRDKEAAIRMLEAGAERLGTSSGVKIVS
ncbi:deoxyribose-phosphate aldolase [Spirochaetes bacterium]|uniref:Deoxyribose-phosphate aldolase n=1 Tax=Candidatus Scatousia excrementipullorum TaxID=2840936 RepID=A0A9D9DMT6_9BACT|nr:deoxyribose-phosphate aldolase [Candidatus Scatousia excrementipullorum]